MEISGSNSEERELQQMQLEERELHHKCLAQFKRLNTPLRNLHSSFVFTNKRPFEIPFSIFFREEHQTFREKMYHTLNQLQWQLERDNFHGHVSKTCLVVLRTQFKEFFNSKEANALDVPNKCWQKSFSDGAKWEPENFRHLLLRYLEELDKLIDERELKYVELQIKECEVEEKKEIENRLKESTTLEACLLNEDIALNDNAGVMESSGTKSKNNSLETPSSRSENETEVLTAKTIVQKGMMQLLILSHEKPESIPDTYEVNKNNSNIIYDMPNMDPDRDKEEHDDRTKKLHDSKIKNRIFNVGDRVLLFNSHLKIFLGNLKTLWSGPFTITKVFPYGTVELSQPDGPKFKVNGHLVKHYFGRDVVPDLQTFPMDK
nr:reverse transcriptase domain-containing protein [Tanacetum cinerariifolium]